MSHQTIATVNHNNTRALGFSRRCQTIAAMTVVLNAAINNNVAYNRFCSDMWGWGNHNLFIAKQNTPQLAAYRRFGGAWFLARRGNRCSYEGVMPRLLAAGIAEARLPIIYYIVSVSYTHLRA